MGVEQYPTIVTKMEPAVIIVWDSDYSEREIVVNLSYVFARAMYRITDDLILRTLADSVTDYIRRMSYRVKGK